MAGLLDFYGDSRANMALAMGLLGGGSFGEAGARGMKNAEAVMLAEEERKLRASQALENAARAKHYQDQMEQAKAKLALDAARQGRIQGILGGGQGGISPGAFAPSADGMGPTMPPQMSEQMRRPGGVIPNLSIDQIAALKHDGLDLTDIYKFAREPQKFEAGATYKDRNTGEERFFPRIGEGGQVVGGKYSNIPGYPEANAAVKGAEAEATARAQAGQDLVDVPLGNNQTVKMPRAQAVRMLGGQQGGGQPQAPTGPYNRMTPGR